MVKRISFNVQGRVQGVSFRYFTQKKARSLNISGWVRNTFDGAVEGEAQGDEVAIQSLVKELGIGPSQARVDKLEKSEIENVDGETRFDVR
ncbi:Acylphosphatase-like domain-containing protein [Calycina marina]|uniref:Acylphosphatase n=1 Tax=Calycina marina TaxID=1763456 RepID=A0A9P8CD38_9HELO|nr:Acylphosphatase-like domain-containing protein [Calycina marina]